jgi:predicted esterase
MNAQTPLVCFSHGKESGPWGTKIRALAEVAREAGFQVLSIDYTAEPDPDARIETLLGKCPREAGSLVLVGSSMGAYVATAASRTLRPDGLFLMAPAFYLEGYREQPPPPVAGRVLIVHGWGDGLVPVEHSIRFARTYRASLLLLDGDHRLESNVPTLCAQFASFLRDIRPR